VGLPDDLPPMVFAFTGNGNVSQGAQEIFNLFPHEYIEPSELATLGVYYTWIRFNAGIYDWI
jgi:alpha-aminoadipic semialdehyde synthase